VSALPVGALLVGVLLVSALLVGALLVSALLLSALPVGAILAGGLLAGCTASAGEADRERRDGRTTSRNLSRFLRTPGLLMMSYLRASTINSLGERWGRKERKKERKKA
jgi:hypothetical protein